MSNFESLLAFGEEGERFVARKLMECGKLVANHFQYKTKQGAPSLFRFEGGKMERLVIPDLQAFGEKGAFWCEVKRKSQWREWNGIWETGTEERLFRHYERVQETSGQPVWLFFGHEKMEPTGLYYVSLKACQNALATGKGARLWDGCNSKTKKKVLREPMVMFDRALMTRLCDFEIDAKEAA